jgi:23S rRNA (adenine2503-C2)-methyltransferase
MPFNKDSGHGELIESMNDKAVQNKLVELKTPVYRLNQARRSYYQELSDGWDKLTTWPIALRRDCSGLSWSPLKITALLESQEPESAKFAFETEDGKTIETVVMRHADGRNTVCVSSQVGCAMKCAFCATGTMGCVRNLTAEEIVDQVIQAARYLRDKHEVREARVTNVVFMGMGEPFNNPDAVFEALRILTSQDYFGLGARHLSVSTCGIVPGIERLAEETPQVNLAISLHAPTQMLREKLMPVSRAYPLERLMRAVRAYTRVTNRKVMFEYVLLKDVNDREADAEDLADLFNDMRHLAHVNLINYHQTGTYEPSTEVVAKRFQNALRRRGISVTRRISFGEEIQAACGQLAASKAE